ncbi:MAG: hypothetical protein H7144_00420 [Burkholderiales bacterium]|nr:hypothetical protein [Phycisphaerae bacterium]
MMKLRLIHLAAICALASLAAAPDERRVELLAAREAARADLRGQILASVIGPGMSVRDLAESDPALVEDLLNASEQVGGPRWLEQDVVQVRLQVPGSRIMERIQPLGRQNPRVTEADLKRLHAEWSRRNFQATGQAIPQSKLLVVVTQSQSPAWRDVSKESRIDAASRAHASAVNAIVVSTSDIQVSPNQSVAQCFATPDAGKQLTAWAATLPATRVLLGEDRQVELALFVDKEGLKQQLRSMVSSDVLGVSNKIAALDLGVSRLPTVMTARAGIEARPIATAPSPAPLVIRKLPAWLNEPLTAEATAARQQTKLRTARLAEQQARETIKTNILKLKIDDQQSIEQAGARDARVLSAIDRAVARARAYQVDYNADGSVAVRVTLDPNDVLDELTGSH